jgi:hypothetical protein
MKAVNVVETFLLDVLRYLYPDDEAKRLYDLYQRTCSVLFSNHLNEIITVTQPKEYAKIKKAFYMIDSIASDERVTISLGTYDCMGDHLIPIDFSKYEHLKYGIYSQDSEVKKQSGNPRLFFSDNCYDLLIERDPNIIFVKPVNELNTQINRAAIWCERHHYKLTGFKDFQNTCLKQLFPDISGNRAYQIYSGLISDNKKETELLATEEPDTTPDS